jgi:hypothetical protein
MQLPFLAQFLLTSLLGVSGATRAENPGGCIANDLNSDGKRSRLENGPSCMGHYVRYYTVTVSSNQLKVPIQGDSELL